MREACKAAGIWENAPLLKELTPRQSRTFYDTVRVCVLNAISCVYHLPVINCTYTYPRAQVFTLCPQITSCWHLLTARLSLTLINRRQFLRRTGKISARPQSHQLVMPPVKLLPASQSSTTSGYELFMFDHYNT